ncbi:hypothetical protein SLA2020_095430 [Shorea laevis]
MGTAEKEQLDRTLNLHINTIHETFQVLDQAPPSSLEKVSWYHVVQMGELLSKQATIGTSYQFYPSTAANDIYVYDFIATSFLMGLSFR